MLPLPVLSQEEEGQGSGAGVGADHRTHIVNVYFCYSVLLLEQSGKILRILPAVAVGDEHHGVIAALGKLPDLGSQGLDGGLPPPGLAYADQVASSST